MLHTPALWYFDKSVICPHKFCGVKFVIIPQYFVKQQYFWNIALQRSVDCYSIWSNLWCSGCQPLGEKSLWNGTIGWVVINLSCMQRNFKLVPHLCTWAKVMEKSSTIFPQTCTFFVPYTVLCRYNEVNFPKTIHKRHPIARPLGSSIWLWIQHPTDILPEFLHSFMQYLIILDCVITALNCT